MKLKLSLMAGLVCLIGALDVSAVTLIEQRDRDSTSIMYLDGARLRTDTPNEAAYGLMDLKKRTMYMVNPDEKTAMDMSSMVWPEKKKGGGDWKKVDASLDKVGDGPTIAGYETVHYVVKANGRKCHDLYASKKAFNHTGWAESWSENGRALNEANIDTADDCEIADYEVADPGNIGWALKTIEADGQYSEVLRIEQDAKLPVGGFEVPADYSLVSYAEMMQGMMSGDFGGMNNGEDGYSGEEDYDDEYYDEEEFDEDDAEDQAFEEELEEEVEKEEEVGVKDKLKGFMKKFGKKKDVD